MNLPKLPSAGLSWLLVALLALGIEYFWGWARLLAPWTSVSLTGLAVALLLMLLSYMLRAWRVADHFTIQGRFVAVLALNLQHNLWNNLLPMRAGELSFPLLMRQQFNTDPAYALAGLFWIRLIDAQVLATLALGSLLWLARVEWLAFGLILFAMLAPFALWMMRARLGTAVAGMRVGKLQTLLNKALHGLPRDGAHFARGVVLTWTNWLVKLAALAWVLRQFLAIAWPGAVLGVVGGEVSSILPLHAPGGFGTYEAGMLATLLPQGMEVSEATRAAINTHLFLLGTSLLFGLGAMLIGGKSATMRPPSHDTPAP